MMDFQELYKRWAADRYGIPVGDIDLVRFRIGDWYDFDNVVIVDVEKNDAGRNVHNTPEEFDEIVESLLEFQARAT